MMHPSDYVYVESDSVHGDDIQNLHDLNRQQSSGAMLPLVYQTGGVSSTPPGSGEQKYSTFVVDFINKNKAEPFL
jgi:hypothetical protein